MVATRTPPPPARRPPAPRGTCASRRQNRESGGWDAAFGSVIAAGILAAGSSAEGRDAGTERRPALLSPYTMSSGATERATREHEGLKSARGPCLLPAAAPASPTAWSRERTRLKLRTTAQTAKEQIHGAYLAVAAVRFRGTRALYRRPDDADPSRAASSGLHQQPQRGARQTPRAPYEARGRAPARHERWARGDPHDRQRQQGRAP